MPKEMILEYLALNEKEEKLKLCLVMETAPLLKGMKQSCILVVTPENLKSIRRELKKTDISCAVLHTREKKEVIMLYRAQAMEQYLQEEKVKKFLQNYGYRCKSLSDYIALLRLRVVCFYEKSHTFPHEIGAFLGYPIQDVEGFIENAGKNYLLSGYWKVYSNMQAAKELFRKFDEAKDSATRELLDGKQLYEIAG